MNAQKVTDKELAALEKRLRSVYKAAWKDLKPSVRKYLESFEPRLKKLTADINAGRIIIPASTTAEEYIKNWKLRYIAQGEEWVKLLNECAERATQANKLAAEITSGKLPGIYGINFNASSYDIAVNAGMQYSVYLPENTIKELTKENANNVNFKILGSTGKPHYFDPTIDVPRDYAWNQKKIQKALTSGIIQGKFTPKIAQDFMKVMGNNQKAAIRNARTACTSAQNAGTIDSMRAAQSMGLEVKKKWLATLDARTRSSHGHLDGECIDLDEKFSNGLEFPGDPNGSPGEVYNCRCTMENYYPGISDELSAGKRRSRNDDGTRGTFTGTYEQWKQSNESAIINKAKAIDSFHGGEKVYTKAQILENLQTSPVGRDVIRRINESNAWIDLDDFETGSGERAWQQGAHIKLYTRNIKSDMVAGQTVVHEMTHYYYNIGKSQHAEAVCFAYEKMHLEKRNYLTEQEWEKIKKLAIDTYPELEWEAGGYGNFEQFDFVRKIK